MFASAVDAGVPVLPPCCCAHHIHAAVLPCFSQLCNVCCVGVGPNGTCLRPSDCNTGFTCKLSPPTTVRRCVMGMDALSRVGSCVALPPPPPPPPPPPTPCQQCQQCLSSLQQFVQSQGFATDAAGAAQAAHKRCQASNMFTNVQCNQLRSDIARSYNGNTARRAGLLCSRLGACSAAALGQNCTLTVASAGNSSANLSGDLDLCTVEGVAGGAMVAGVTGQTGE